MCIDPSGTVESGPLILQDRFKPSEIYMKALQSSGSWNGAFSSYHFVMDISVTPFLSV